MIFHGGGKEHTLITKFEKIVVPDKLQQRIVDWYHQQLCHPGTKRTEATIRQHFTFKNVRKMVEDTIKICPICQKYKKGISKFGFLPEKVAEANPWEKLCTNLIGPYDIKIRGKKHRLWCLTMVDPATNWFEMKEIKEKTAINIANVVEQVWLTR